MKQASEKKRADSNLGASMSSMKSQTTSEIKAAAEAELAELQSQSSSRHKSNPRMLKPITASESMKTSNAIITKNREQKKMYQELSKEISSLSKEDSLIKSYDVMKELNDAFTGNSKMTNAQKKTRQSEKPPETIVSGSSDTIVDPKVQRREELKRKAIAMSNKSKGTISDAASQFSDMSYQSDISGLQPAFITTTKQAKRPSSVRKLGLEPIVEQALVVFKCPSPQFKQTQALQIQSSNEVYDQRLDVYLEETQGYLDYLQDLEGEIVDQRDLKEIGTMKELCAKAVDEHLKMCDTVVADLCDMTLEVEEEIRKSKMLGIEADHAYEYHEEAKLMVEDYSRRIVQKIEQPAQFSQVEIKSGKVLALCADEDTNQITTTLKDIFKTLDTFTKMMETRLDVEAKLGLPQPAIEVTAVSREERFEDVKLNRMAMQAQKYMETHEIKQGKTKDGSKALVAKLSKK